MNDLECIDMLRSVHGYVVAGLLPGYIMRSDKDVLPDTLSLLVGHWLTLSEH